MDLKESTQRLTLFRYVMVRSNSILSIHLSFVSLDTLESKYFSNFGLSSEILQNSSS